MAKKMLINADMLLATPRRQETVAPKVVDGVKESEEPAVYKATPPTIVEKSTIVEEETPPPPPVMEPKPEPKKIAAISSVQKGLKAGETRATFIVKEDTLEKIKAIAYWDRQNIKDVMQTAIENYIKEYEQKQGVVRPVP
jgi:hypothetical protein